MGIQKTTYLKPVKLINYEEKKRTNRKKLYEDCDRDRLSKLANNIDLSAFISRSPLLPKVPKFKIPQISINISTSKLPVIVESDKTYYYDPYKKNIKWQTDNPTFMSNFPINLIEKAKQLEDEFQQELSRANSIIECSEQISDELFVQLETDADTEVQTPNAELEYMDDDILIELGGLDSDYTIYEKAQILEIEMQNEFKRLYNPKHSIYHVNDIKNIEKNINIDELDNILQSFF